MTRMTSAFELPRKTIIIRWDRGHMRVLLHLAMPRMNKDDAAKVFSTLRKFVHFEGNRELVPEIRDWFYEATLVSHAAWKQATKNMQDNHRSLDGYYGHARAEIGRENAKLLREERAAHRINERLEDRLALFEEMLKGYYDEDTGYGH